MLLILAISALLLAAVPALLFLDNLRRFRPAPAAAGRSSESASVLIPARNEEAAIADCVRSVLAHPDPQLEVIVLDDGSTDRTAPIVRGIARQDPRVRLEIAPPLPAGWCGKQHACHHLSTLASRPWLVFIDADVRLEADAVPRAIAFAQQADAALVSGFPRQQTLTLAEQVLIPLIHFVLLCFLPMAWMRRSRWPAFGAGCGQIFVARRSAYDHAGGHGAIRDSMHDGVTLPRAFRVAGLKTDLFDATDVGTCRMYSGLEQTWNGLVKNAAEGMGSPAAILPWTILLGVGQVLPPLLLAIAAAQAAHRPVALTVCAVALTISYTVRFIAAWRFKQSWRGALLHPLGVAMLLAIQWYALTRHLAGCASTWRGRSYATRPATSG